MSGNGAMRAKSSRGIKIKWYSAIGITVASLLLVSAAGLLISRFLLKLPASPVGLEPSVPDANVPTAAPSASTTPVPLRPTATPTPAVQDTQPTDRPVTKQSAAAVVTRQGLLRVSNPTEYPVRVALLAKQANSATAKATSGYEVPAHWDFAPEEGGTQGLVVSLPDRTLKVKKGDVLVAFAQDGSRRYWGPYVVGETELPIWNAAAAEWQLSLQP